MGGGAAEIAAVLHDLLDCPVAVVNPDGGVSVVGVADAQGLDPMAVAATRQPVRAGDQDYRQIIALTSGSPLATDGPIALERAAVPLAARPAQASAVAGGAGAVRRHLARGAHRRPRRIGCGGRRTGAQLWMGPGTAARSGCSRRSTRLRTTPSRHDAAAIAAATRTTPSDETRDPRGDSRPGASRTGPGCSRSSSISCATSCASRRATEGGARSRYGP